MKVFLLGHRGFLGSHLLPKLQTLGHDVITDLRYWDERFDVVINLAAKTHLRMEFDPQLIESNYILVDKVFRRSERIVYASSCSAKYNTNPYAASKIWAEYLGEKHGNAVGFRFHNIYGTGNNKGIVWFLMNCIDGQKITIRGDQLVRDYIAVENCVDEIIKCVAPVYVMNKMGMKNFEKHITEGVAGLTSERMEEDKLCRLEMERLLHFDKFNGVLDVGTGIGTQTMDLVNLYMKLSGKSFIIDVEEAGSNEPKSMIAENCVGKISLEEGLLKMINHE